MWAVLYILAEYGGVSLKPIKGWLAVTSVLMLWFASIPFWGDHSWRSALLGCYYGTALLLGWVKRSYLFESKVKPEKSLASLLTVSQPTYIAVRDVATASPWYSEKFGLRKLAAPEQIRTDGAAFRFNEKTHPVVLVPRDLVAPRPVPVFFSTKLGKVRDALISRGVSTGPVQQDRQGTRFFELFDAEGNTVEISERP